MMYFIFVVFILISSAKSQYSDVRLKTDSDNIYFNTLPPTTSTFFNTLWPIKETTSIIWPSLEDLIKALQKVRSNRKNIGKPWYVVVIPWTKEPQTDYDTTKIKALKKIGKYYGKYLNIIPSTTPMTTETSNEIEDTTVDPFVDKPWHLAIVTADTEISIIPVTESIIPSSKTHTDLEVINDNGDGDPRYFETEATTYPSYNLDLPKHIRQNEDPWYLELNLDSTSSDSNLETYDENEINRLDHQREHKQWYFIDPLTNLPYNKQQYLHLRKKGKRKVKVLPLRKRTLTIDSFDDSQISDEHSKVRVKRKDRPWYAEVVPPTKQPPISFGDTEMSEGNFEIRALTETPKGFVRLFQDDVNDASFTLQDFLNASLSSDAEETTLDSNYEFLKTFFRPINVKEASTSNYDTNKHHKNDADDISLLTSDEDNTTPTRVLIVSDPPDRTIHLIDSALRKTKTSFTARKDNTISTTEAYAKASARFFIATDMKETTQESKMSFNKVKNEKVAKTPARFFVANDVKPTHHQHIHSNKIKDITLAPKHGGYRKFSEEDAVQNTNDKSTTQTARFFVASDKIDTTTVKYDKSNKKLFVANLEDLTTASHEKFTPVKYFVANEIDDTTVSSRDENLNADLVKSNIKMKTSTPPEQSRNISPGDVTHPIDTIIPDIPEFKVNNFIEKSKDAASDEHLSPPKRVSDTEGSNKVKGNWISYIGASKMKETVAETRKSAKVAASSVKKITTRKFDENIEKFFIKNKDTTTSDAHDTTTKHGFKPYFTRSKLKGKKNEKYSTSILRYFVESKLKDSTTKDYDESIKELLIPTTTVKVAEKYSTSPVRFFVEIKDSTTHKNNENVELSLKNNFKDTYSSKYEDPVKKYKNTFATTHAYDESIKKFFIEIKNEYTTSKPKDFTVGNKDDLSKIFPVIKVTDSPIFTLGGYIKPTRVYTVANMTLPTPASKKDTDTSPDKLSKATPRYFSALDASKSDKIINAVKTKSDKKTYLTLSKGKDEFLREHKEHRKTTPASVAIVINTPKIKTSADLKFALPEHRYRINEKSNKKSLPDEFIKIHTTLHSRDSQGQYTTIAPLKSKWHKLPGNTKLSTKIISNKLKNKKLVTQMHMKWRPDVKVPNKHLKLIPVKISNYIKTKPKTSTEEYASTEVIPVISTSRHFKKLFDYIDKEFGKQKTADVYGDETELLENISTLKISTYEPIESTTIDEIDNPKKDPEFIDFFSSKSHVQLAPDDYRDIFVEETIPPDIVLSEPKMGYFKPTTDAAIKKYEFVTEPVPIISVVKPSNKTSYHVTRKFQKVDKAIVTTIAPEVLKNEFVDHNALGSTRTNTKATSTVSIPSDTKLPNTNTINKTPIAHHFEPVPTAATFSVTPSLFIKDVKDDFNEDTVLPDFTVSDPEQSYHVKPIDSSTVGIEYIKQPTTLIPENVDLALEYEVTIPNVEEKDRDNNMLDDESTTAITESSSVGVQVDNAINVRDKQNGGVDDAIFPEPDIYGENSLAANPRYFIAEYNARSRSNVEDSANDEVLIPVSNNELDDERKLMNDEDILDEIIHSSNTEDFLKTSKEPIHDTNKSSFITFMIITPTASTDEEETFESNTVLPTLHFALPTNIIISGQTKPRPTRTTKTADAKVNGNETIGFEVVDPLAAAEYNVTYFFPNEDTGIDNEDENLVESEIEQDRVEHEKQTDDTEKFIPDIPMNEEVKSSTETLASKHEEITVTVPIADIAIDEDEQTDTESNDFKEYTSQKNKLIKSQSSEKNKNTQNVKASKIDKETSTSDPNEDLDDILSDEEENDKDDHEHLENEAEVLKENKPFESKITTRKSIIENQGDNEEEERSTPFFRKSYSSFVRPYQNKLSLIEKNINKILSSGKNAFFKKFDHRPVLSYTSKPKVNEIPKSSVIKPLHQHNIKVPKKSKKPTTTPKPKATIPGKKKFNWESNKLQKMKGVAATAAIETQLNKLHHYKKVKEQQYKTITKSKNTVKPDVKDGIAHKISSNDAGRPTQESFGEKSQQKSAKKQKSQENKKVALADNKLKDKMDSVNERIMIQSTPAIYTSTEQSIDHQTIKLTDPATRATTKYPIYVPLKNTQERNQTDFGNLRRYNDARLTITDRLNKASPTIGDEDDEYKEEPNDTDISNFRRYNNAYSTTTEHLNKASPTAEVDTYKVLPVAKIDLNNTNTIETQITKAVAATDLIYQVLTPPVTIETKEITESTVTNKIYTESTKAHLMEAHSVEGHATKADVTEAHTTEAHATKAHVTKAQTTEAPTTEAQFQPQTHRTSTYKTTTNKILHVNEIIEDLLPMVGFTDFKQKMEMHTEKSLPKNQILKETNQFDQVKADKKLPNVMLSSVYQGITNNTEQKLNKTYSVTIKSNFMPVHQILEDLLPTERDFGPSKDITTKAHPYVKLTSQSIDSAQIKESGAYQTTPSIVYLSAVMIEKPDTNLETERNEIIHKKEKAGSEIKNNETNPEKELLKNQTFNKIFSNESSVNKMTVDKKLVTTENSYTTVTISNLSYKPVHLTSSHINNVPSTVDHYPVSPKIDKVYTTTGFKNKVEKVATENAMEKATTEKAITVKATSEKAITVKTTTEKATTEEATTQKTTTEKTTTEKTTTEKTTTGIVLLTQINYNKELIPENSLLDLKLNESNKLANEVEKNMDNLLQVPVLGTIFPTFGSWPNVTFNPSKHDKRSTTVTENVRAFTTSYKTTENLPPGRNLFVPEESEIQQNVYINTETDRPPTMVDKYAYRTLEDDIDTTEYKENSQLRVTFATDDRYIKTEAPLASDDKYSSTTEDPTTNTSPTSVVFNVLNKYLDKTTPVSTNFTHDELMTKHARKLGPNFSILVDTMLDVLSNNTYIIKLLKSDKSLQDWNPDKIKAHLNKIVSKVVAKEVIKSTNHTFDNINTPVDDKDTFKGTKAFSGFSKNVFGTFGTYINTISPNETQMKVTPSIVLLPAESYQANTDDESDEMFENEPLFSDRDIYEFETKKHFVETLLSVIFNNSFYSDNKTSNNTNLKSTLLNRSSPIYTSVVDTVLNRFLSKNQPKNIFTVEPTMTTEDKILYYAEENVKDTNSLEKFTTNNDKDMAEATSAVITYDTKLTTLNDEDYYKKTFLDKNATLVSIDESKLKVKSDLRDLPKLKPTISEDVDDWSKLSGDNIYKNKAMVLKEMQHGKASPALYDSAYYTPLTQRTKTYSSKKPNVDVKGTQKLILDRPVLMNETLSEYPWETVKVEGENDSITTKVITTTTVKVATNKYVTFPKETAFNYDDEDEDLAQDISVDSDVFKSFTSAHRNASESESNKLLTESSHLEKQNLTMNESVRLDHIINANIKLLDAAVLTQTTYLSSSLPTNSSVAVYTNKSEELAVKMQPIVVDTVTDKDNKTVFTIRIGNETYISSTHIGITLANATHTTPVVGISITKDAKVTPQVGNLVREKTVTSKIDENIAKTMYTTARTESLTQNTNTTPEIDIINEALEIEINVPKNEQVTPTVENIENTSPEMTYFSPALEINVNEVGNFSLDKGISKVNVPSTKSNFEVTQTTEETNLTKYPSVRDKVDTILDDVSTTPKFESTTKQNFFTPQLEISTTKTRYILSRTETSTAKFLPISSSVQSIAKTRYFTPNTEAYLTKRATSPKVDLSLTNIYVTPIVESIAKNGNFTPKMATTTAKLVTQKVDIITRNTSPKTFTIPKYVQVSPKTDKKATYDSSKVLTYFKHKNKNGECAITKVDKDKNKDYKYTVKDTLTQMFLVTKSTYPEKVDDAYIDSDYEYNVKPYVNLLRGTTKWPKIKLQNEEVMNKTKEIDELTATLEEFLRKMYGISGKSFIKTISKINNKNQKDLIASVAKINGIDDKDLIDPIENETYLPDTEDTIQDEVQVYLNKLAETRRFEHTTPKETKYQFPPKINKTAILLKQRATTKATLFEPATFGRVISTNVYTPTAKQVFSVTSVNNYVYPRETTTKILPTTTQQVTTKEHYKSTVRDVDKSIATSTRASTRATTRASSVTTATSKSVHPPTTQSTISSSSDEPLTISLIQDPLTTAEEPQSSTTNEEDLEGKIKSLQESIEDDESGEFENVSVKILEDDEDDDDDEYIEEDDEPDKASGNTKPTRKPHKAKSIDVEFIENILIPYFDEHVNTSERPLNVTTVTNDWVENELLGNRTYKHKSYSFTQSSENAGKNLAQLVKTSDLLTLSNLDLNLTKPNYNTSYLNVSGTTEGAYQLYVNQTFINETLTDVTLMKKTLFTNETIEDIKILIDKIFQKKIQRDRKMSVNETDDKVRNVTRMDVEQFLDQLFTNVTTEKYLDRIMPYEELVNEAVYNETPEELADIIDDLDIKDELPPRLPKQTTSTKKVESVTQPTLLKKIHLTKVLSLARPIKTPMIKNLPKHLNETLIKSGFLPKTKELSVKTASILMKYIQSLISRRYWKAIAESELNRRKQAYEQQTQVITPKYQTTTYLYGENQMPTFNGYSIQSNNINSQRTFSPLMEMIPTADPNEQKTGNDLYKKFSPIFDPIEMKQAKEQKKLLLDTCGFENSNTNHAKIGTARIETYPWLGVLLYPKGPHRLVTRVVLVTVQLVIGSALDIDKLPKKDFREQAKVVLGHNCTGPRIDVLTYNYHPEFRAGFYNALALIQIDTSIHLNKLRPLCAPPKVFVEDATFYAMVLPDDCRSSKLRIYELDFVPLNICKDFYEQPGLEAVGAWPRHALCARTRRGGECVWRAGASVLVVKQEYRWHMLGFGITGPGCEAPSRYIDYTEYSGWVAATVARIGQPAVTRLAPNQLVLRRSLNQIQRFGPCDRGEVAIEIFTDTTDVQPSLNEAGEGWVQYDLTIFNNVEYHCVVFHAYNMEAQGRPPPRIELRPSCRYPPAFCLSLSSYLPIDFFVTIYYSQPIKYKVLAFGKEAHAKIKRSETKTLQKSNPIHISDSNVHAATIRRYKKSQKTLQKYKNAFQHRILSKNKRDNNMISKINEIVKLKMQALYNTTDLKNSIT